MPDITINRCKLRIVRRGGWSWGPEPRKLLQSAISALPELIARELARLWPDDAEVEIAGPVRISVPVKMSELLAAATISQSDDAGYTQSSRFGVSERIAQAVRAAVEQVVVEPSLSFQFEKQPNNQQSNNQEGEAEAAQVTEKWPGGAVLQSLMAWRASGVLDMRLAAFSQAALESWYRRALGGAGQSVDLDSASQAMLDELVDEIAIRSRIAPHNRQYIMRLRLLAVADAMAKLHLEPNATPLREALSRALPLEDEVDGQIASSRNMAHTVETEDKLSEREAQSTARPEPSGPEPSNVLPRSPRRRAKPSTDRHVASSLPFLLLGPLSRLGYLKTLTATMEAAELATETPLFAAALANKVLAPPVRGWRREYAMIEAASAFAALDEPAAEHDLAAFARQVSPHLSPLDAVLSGALIAGHDANQPLLLYRTSADAYGGFLLVDAEGNCPIAWAEKLSGLRQTLIHLDSSVVLIPQATADTELLGWMDGEGFRFITDTTPTRGEQWRALRPRSQERGGRTIRSPENRPSCGWRER